MYVLNSEQVPELINTQYIEDSVNMAVCIRQTADARLMTSQAAYYVWFISA